MRLIIIGAALAALSLTGCTKERIVYRDRVVEKKVPVTVPCMGTAPDPVTALRETYGRDEWDALSTDQRANLIAANALAWRIFGWQATDQSAGCQ